MKPAVHCLLVVLVFGVVIGEDQLGAIAHERGNVVRERRSPFLSFPGGGFGVGVRYDDTRYRSIPGMQSSAGIMFIVNQLGFTYRVYLSTI